MRAKRGSRLIYLKSFGDDNLQKLYNECGSFSKLSKILKIPISVLCNYFEKNNLVAFHYNKVLPKKIIDKEIILHFLNEVISLNDLIKKLKCSQNTLRRSLKYHQIPYPNFRGLYDCNENFFDLSYLNEKSMYWAGVLSADGNLRKHKNYNGYNIKLELSAKDKNHIEKFRQDINYNGRIIDGKKRASKLLQQSKNHKEWYYYSYLIISSKKIFDDLGKFGIFPQKTYTYTMPDWLINHPLVNHFIRGYIDADGSYSINKRNNKDVSVHVFLGGACPAIEQIWNIIKDRCSPKFGNFLEKNMNERKFYSFIFNGLQDNVNIINFIYNNASIYMDRKKIRAEKVYEMLENTSHYFFDPAELQELYDRFGSFNGVAKYLNCDRDTIRLNMHKFGLNYKSMPQMRRNKK